MVPWLQTTAVAVKLPPGVTLGGPETDDTIRSGLFPTPIWVPDTAELLPSLSSTMPFHPSTMAPTYHRPPGMPLADPLTETVAHCPGSRPGTGALLTTASVVALMVVSAER